jgi:hypothetical protein
MATSQSRSLPFRRAVRVFPLLVALVAARPASAGVRRLTSNSVDDLVPQINQSGQVAWWANQQSYFWNGSAIRQLTDPSTWSGVPQLNDVGQVAWEGSSQIWLWNGASIRQISNRPVSNARPQINRAGQVVWRGNDGTSDQLYLWSGSSVQQLTNNSEFKGYPQINTSGQVAWLGSDGITSQIYFWNGSSVRSLQHVSLYTWDPLLNDAGQVVWWSQGSDGREQIFFWNGSTVQQLSDSAAFGNNAQLNAAGAVAWVGPGSIELWNGGSRQFIPISSLPYATLRMNSSRQLVWDAMYQVYLWNGAGTVLLTPNGSGSDPQINDAGQVVWTGWDGADREIYLYTPTGPGSLDLLTADPVTGGDLATGLVRLTGPAPAGGAVVALRSANPAAASVPASVTVPAGATMATFPVTTFSVASSTSVTLSASYGSATWTSSIHVDSIALATLQTAGSSVGSGSSLWTTVTLTHQAPSAGTTVTLTSSNPAVVSVPATVTVTAGRDTASFSASTVAITSTTSVTLSASCGGVTRSVTVQVLPYLTGFSVSPSVVPAGTTATGTVTIAGPAPAGGLTVGLFSTKPAAVPLPARVSVPAGVTSASFPITTSAVSAATSATLVATLGRSLTTSLSVMPVGVSFTPASLSGGQPSTGTVVLPTAAPVGGAVVTLGSSNPSLASPPASVTVPEGARLITFTVRTFPVASNTPVTLSAAYGGTTWTGTLQLQPPQLLSMALNPPAIRTGGTGSGIVTLNVPAPGGGILVSLVSSDTRYATVPASITVPAGATSATFPVTGQWQGTGAVQIYASYGATNLVATLQVIPILNSFRLNPYAVPGGVSTTGEIGLTGAAPAGGLGVGVSCGNPAVVTVPSQVVVREGVAGTTFSIATHSVTEPTLVPIWASAGGVGTVNLWVLPVGLSFTPGRIQGGQYSTGTVVLPAPAPAGGALVTLTSANPGLASAPASVTVPEGVRMATFPVRTTAVGTPTTVALSALSAGTTWTRTLTVIP